MKVAAPIQPRLLSGNGRAYVVQKGECLSVIGARLGFDWRALAKINGLREPYLIWPGQMIVLPDT